MHASRSPAWPAALFKPQKGVQRPSGMDRRGGPCGHCPGCNGQVKRAHKRAQGVGGYWHEGCVRQHPESGWQLAANARRDRMRTVAPAGSPARPARRWTTQSGNRAHFFQQIILDTLGQKNLCHSRRARIGDTLRTRARARVWGRTGCVAGQRRETQTVVCNACVFSSDVSCTVLCG